MAVDRPLQPGPPLIPQNHPLLIDLPPRADTVTTETDDGGVIVDFEPRGAAPIDVAHDTNLAEHIESTELAVLASDLLAKYQGDRQSRAVWEQTYIEGIDLLGLRFEERIEPWDGASGVFHPLLAESIVNFQAQTSQAIFPSSGPAKTRIEGKSDTERRKQAHRVQDYLNYLATVKMTEYFPETETLLFVLPLAGSCFRKVYHDHTVDRPRALYVPPEDLVVDYATTDLATANRITHIMRRSPNWVRKKQVSGFYRDIELPSSTPSVDEIRQKLDKMQGVERSYEYDDRRCLLEMHVELDLPGFEDPDGIELPYIVTIDESSQEVLAIYRNWMEDDVNRERREWFSHYRYLPGFGFYGFGLTHMIGGLAKGSTSILRQLIDAGTLANLPGGFKTRGLQIRGDDTPITPGEWRDVDVAAGALRDNFMPLPYKEPSTVLYQMLGDMVETGRRFASAADLKAAEMNAEAPVGTTLALLEKAMKIMNAVQRRVHMAMGVELRLLSNCIRDYGPERYPYDVDGDFTPREDFDARVDIIPVSDPNAGTMAQKIMQYQAALQLAATAPQLYDMPLLHRQMLEVLGVQEVSKIIPSDEDMAAMDPVSENMAIINGKPVRAFLYQDHEAHIQTHLSMAQHPKIMALLEKSPNAEQVMAAGQAHIAEHVAMAYREQVERELGVPLPPPDEPLPEDIELRLSRMVAPAAAQLTGKAQQQAQAEKNAEMQQDPMIQLQQREQDRKDREQTAKERESIMRIVSDMQKAHMRLEAERKRNDQQGEIALGNLIAKFAELAKDDRHLTNREQLEGFRVGLGFVQQLLREELKENVGQRQQLI